MSYMLDHFRLGSNFVTYSHDKKNTTRVYEEIRTYKAAHNQK